MSLRRKTLLIVCAALAFFVVAFIVISNTVLLSGYEDLEQEQSLENVKRVSAAIDEMLDSLERNTRDWAGWDDTYAFMEDLNDSYISSNLILDVLENLDLNLILYFDTTGFMVYGVGREAGTGIGMPVPDGLVKLTSATRNLLAASDNSPGATGLMSLPEGDFLFAAQPILTSEREGPCRGTLVMARSFDEAEIEKLSRLTELEIELVHSGAAGMPVDFAEAAKQLEAGATVYSRNLDGDWIAGYTWLPDVGGDSVLLMRVEASRYIYKQGRSTMFTLTWAVLLSCLVLGGLFLLMLELLVLKRLSLVSEGILEITRSGDPNLRLPVSGRDEISRLAGVTNDMLERLEGSRNKLEESEGRYRELVDKAQDIIYTLSERDGVFTSLNPAFEELTGWLVKDWIGKPFYPLIHPDDRERATLAYSMIGENRTPPAQEFRILSSRGGFLTLEFIITPLARNDRVEGAFGIGRDVTRRKLMRERLEKLNQCFINLSTNPRDNIQKIIDTGLDVLGGELMKYCRSTGGRDIVLSLRPGLGALAEPESPGTHIFNDVLLKNGKKELQVHDFTGIDFEQIDPDIALYSLLSSLGYPVGLEGRPRGNLRVFSRENKGFDSEEIEIMGILARAVSMEEERREYEESLKDFVEVASHELRHPVTVMKGYALTLMRCGPEIPDETKEEILQAISAGADRLERLVSQLLDVARIERNKFPVEVEPALIRPLADRAVQEMRERGLPHQLILRTQGDTGYVQTDPERLVQLLVILLENAAKFSPSGSEVEIELEKQNARVLISVLDRGPGVPQEDREHIFDRFYQVEEAMHHSTPGIGIGLYVARQIAEAQGESIWYEPRPGGGSIFCFTMRLQAAAP